MTAFKYFRMLALVTVMLATGISLPLLHRWFTESRIFSVDKISILSCSERRSKEIQVYLKAYLGKPIYGISLDEVKDRVEQHPWIRSAVVRRYPPHELQIHVRERQPVALLALDRLYVVDDAGDLFKLATDDDGLHLPLITGILRTNLKPVAEIVQALRDHQDAKRPGGEITEWRISKLGRVSAYFASGLEVVLGRGDYAAKWRKLVRLEDELSDKENNFAFAYLDDYPNSDQVAVKVKKSGTF